MIQKRLLNRFKDKNPSPLNNLDFLLTHTYGNIIEMSNKIDTERETMAKAGAALSNVIEIAVLCTSLASAEKMSDQQVELLRSFVSPVVDDGNLLSEMGWEETCYASTAHLLRTCLSRKQ